MSLRVAVVGAAGYVGGELLRLLLQHPEISEVTATSRSQVGVALGDVHPALAPVTAARFSGASPGEVARGADVVYLALEHDWSGTAVRAAHQFLAQRHSTWPAFRRRADGPFLTVADVAGATTPDDHASRVQAWARSVWSSWAPEHPDVGSWAEAVLSPEDRARLRLA